MLVKAEHRSTSALLEALGQRGPGWVGITGPRRPCRGQGPGAFSASLSWPERPAAERRAVGEDNTRGGPPSPPLPASRVAMTLQ